MTRRRTLRLAFAGGLLLLLAPGFLAWRADRQLPQHEGRSARAWFQRYHREYALDRVSVADAVARLECETAFLEMSPGVLPFLANEALSPRSDSALRTNLHGVFSELPSWAGRGLFAPASLAPEAAIVLIDTLRPPAGLLLPLLEPALAEEDSTPAGKARSRPFNAVRLLGGCSAPSDPAAQRLITLLETARSPVTRRAITNSLRQLAGTSPTARAWFLQAWSEVDPTPVLYPLARLLSPADTRFVPRLEAVLAGTNDIARLRAAVALLRIHPEHQGALAELVDLLPTSGRRVATRRADRSRAEAAAWLGGILQGARDLQSEPLRLIVEPLFREEMQLWTPDAGTYRYFPSLARLAPDRTRSLLREALNGEGGTIAAGLLLRFDRGDADATQRLVQGLRSAPGKNRLAFRFLRDIASTNEAGMRLLQECLRHPEALIQGNDPRVGTDYIRAEARQALAEIRYRDARERRGLPDDTW